MLDTRRSWLMSGVLAVAAGAASGPFGTPARAAPTPAPATAPSTATAAAPGGASPSTNPSDAAPDEARIVAAVMRLGAGNFRARQEATKQLWAWGDRAVPALKAAAAGDDPEIARRAKAVLDDFAYGVRPDTPKAVVDLLDQYRSANPDRRQQVARALAANDLPGVRVLLKLAQDEKDATARQGLLQALVSQLPNNVLGGALVYRSAAAKLIGEGDLRTAGQLLQLVAGQHEAAARDWAAFLATRGGGPKAIDDELLRLGFPGPPAPVRPAPAGPPAPGTPQEEFDDAGSVLDAALRAAFLYRAKGDLPAARAAAARAADESTATPAVDALLVEAGEWRALADRADKRGVETNSIEDLGYAAAYHRLAGDGDAARKLADKIKAYADDNPNDHWNAAEALFLNDRPDLALAVLRSSKNYAAEVDFRGARLEFDQALEALRLAKADGAADLTRVRARAAAAQHFVGRRKEAAAALDKAVSGEDGIVDFGTWLEVIEAARATGQPQKAVDGWCLAALRSARANRPQEAPAKVFEKAGFDRPEQAGDWWAARADAGQSPASTLALLRAWDRKEPAADVGRFMATAAEDAYRLTSAEDRDARLTLIVDTLADLGRTDDATAVAEKFADASNTAASLSRLGDAYAAAGKWDKAADAYGRAWDRDRTAAGPLLLRGTALRKCGRAAEAAAVVETAHALPLANQLDRHALMDLAARHDLPDEARRERQLILRTAELGSWERGDALRREAEDLHAKGEDLAAADLWDRAFLNNLNTRVQFVEQQANLMIPGMIHRVRAQGLVKAGRVDEALAQAKACWDNCPGDADSQIAIVNTLTEAGRAAEADAVYGRAKAHYAKQAADYPDSPSANNLLAWYEGKCKRDLDDALAHAKRAAELEPDNTAILDTLAEVHFQRGDVAAALELVDRCLKLEPASEHHKKNLERFRAAKEGKANEGGPSTRPAAGL